ncbi:acyltransferase [Leptospira santarosai str. CBC1531]|nr:acyltransferase [Leptospira santarosai str. CBC1531]
MAYPRKNEKIILQRFTYRSFFLSSTFVSNTIPVKDYETHRNDSTMRICLKLLILPAKNDRMIPFIYPPFVIRIDRRSRILRVFYKRTNRFCDETEPKFRNSKKEFLFFVTFPFILAQIRRMNSQKTHTDKKQDPSDTEPEIHPGSSLRARKILRWFGRIYGSLFYKTDVTGLENVPKEGTVLVLVKHQRNDDIPVGLAKGLYKARWDIWAIMKDSMAAPIFFDFFLKCGGIPLNRLEPRKSKRDLLFARKVLYNGNMLVIFPEQTTIPYKMGRGKPGAFRFIVGKPETPLPVLCLGLDYRPRGFLRRTKLSIRIGKLKYLNPNENPEEFLHECMHEIAKLTNLVYPFEFKKSKLESFEELDSPKVESTV